MTTVQIVGIAVAAAVVVLLIVALLVTRRRGAADEAPAAKSGASFLDSAPQDTLAGLGKVEQPVEDITLDPEATRALLDASPEAVAAASAAGDLEPDGPLSLDWGPSPHEPGPAAPEAAPAAASEAAPEAGSAAAPVAPAPAAPPAPTGGGRKVPLSDIIVTTSSKVVDLDDPEVRLMLTDLVKFEIDQATRFREQGQDIDAVLQLTEAEKISRALGMQESAAAIRRMMEDLKRQV